MAQPAKGIQKTDVVYQALSPVFTIVVLQNSAHGQQHSTFSGMQWQYSKDIFNKWIQTYNHPQKDCKDCLPLRCLMCGGCGEVPIPTSNFSLFAGLEKY